MRIVVRSVSLSVFVTLGSNLVAQGPSPATATAPDPLPMKHAAAPTLPAIAPADLMSWLYAYADDSMMGREAGSPWNLKATAWIADQARQMGLVPAGENGTYFQDVPLVQVVYDSTGTLGTAAATFTAWTDFIPRDQARPTRSLDGVPVVYAGVWGDSAIPPEPAAGKLVLIGVRSGTNPSGQPAWQVNRIQASNRYRGAAGIAIASMDHMSPDFRAGLREPRITMRGAAQSDTAVVPSYLYVTAAMAQALLGRSLAGAAPGTAGGTVRGRVAFVDVPAPARNVVALLPGSDAKLKGTYVAIGAHNDHVGFGHFPVDHDSLRAFNTAVRRLVDSLPPGRSVSPQLFAGIRVNVDSLRRLRPARPDSIFNGADDDASGTVTVLEIAEQFAAERQRPARSLLFIWHSAEELGLYGAQWFTDHPTVPRDSIVAQLNIDMVGRGEAADLKGGGPGYLQLIGSRRLSTELGDLVESVNKTQRQPFTFDYQYDAAGHPEQFYCRSDHYEYARYGIPIVFFSTGDHQDYHQVTDEPQYIAYAHLTRVAQLIHDVAKSVANLDHRVAVDKPKPDPNAPCRQ
ncbi:MAG: M28 family peptidase [Gemmatimonadales bacterium]